MLSVYETISNETHRLRTARDTAPIQLVYFETIANVEQSGIVFPE